MSGVVIKAGETRNPSRGFYSLELRDIAREAQAVLSSARAEAAKIVNDARRQARAEREAVRAEAEKAGHAKGLAEGRAAGHAEALAEAQQAFAKQNASLVTSMTALNTAIGERQDGLFAEARRDVVVLALTIASRLFKGFESLAGAPPAAALQACESALELLRDATAISVKVHPEDAAAIERLADDFARSLKETRHLHIQEDEQVERGGVIVESADCRIDAGIRRRLDRIADELVTEWRSRLKELSLES